jgi:multidrug efflux system membrane fusion protein
MLGIACVPLAGCAAKPQARKPRVSVTVAVAEQREVPFALVSTGTIEPLQTAAVGAQVGGVVTRVAFHEGDEVRAGQVLFELDRRPFRAAYEQALAALARDRAQAETARLEAERAQALFERSLISQSERDAKRAAAATWTATVQADQAAVQSARLNLGYASIRAPIAGRTGRLMVHEGDLVRTGTSEPLVTINQTRPVRVSFTVPVSAVPLVQRYRSAHPRVVVRASADSAMVEGPLVFVDNAVDPASGTLLLKGEFANRDGRLVPGEFVDVRLVLYVEPQATVVPALAVTAGQAGSFVYVLNRDSTVTPRPVKVARTVDEVAVLEGGIRPGETVITDGQLRLSPGAKVLVRSGVGSAQ